jgi:hypothetical protein
LFSDTDALVFIGEVNSAQILAEQNSEKIKACLDALRDRKLEWTAVKLDCIAIGGSQQWTKAFTAYSDFA